jgi:hypothetical protein
MALLSLFDSAQVNFKMLQCKTFPNVTGRFSNTTGNYSSIMGRFSSITFKTVMPAYSRIRRARLIAKIE